DIRFTSLSRLGRRFDLGQVCRDGTLEPLYFFPQAAVHHDRKPGPGRDLGRLLALDTFLQPEHGPSGQLCGFPGDAGCGLRRPEHLHHIHRHRDLLKARVHLLAQYGATPRVDGDDLVADALELPGHAVAGTAGVGREAHHGDNLRPPPAAPVVHGHGSVAGDAADHGFAVEDRLTGLA